MNGLLNILKFHIYLVFSLYFYLEHKNIEAEKLHVFPPQLLTFNLYFKGNAENSIAFLIGKCPIGTGSFWYISDWGRFFFGKRTVPNQKNPLGEKFSEGKK